MMRCPHDAGTVRSTTRGGGGEPQRGCAPKLAAGDYPRCAPSQASVSSTTVESDGSQ